MATAKLPAHRNPSKIINALKVIDAKLKSQEKLNSKFLIGDELISSRHLLATYEYVHDTGN